MRITLTTADAPGAIAIVQVMGVGVESLLLQLTGHGEWPVGRLRLVKFDDIDEGLAGLVTAGCAQLMPHGGPRVVCRLIDRCVALGATYDPAPPPREVYPEASCELEADMLAAIAAAASPVAVDLLAKQPALWRGFLPLPLGEGGESSSRVRVHPPMTDGGDRRRHPLPNPLPPPDKGEGAGPRVLVPPPSSLVPLPSSLFPLPDPRDHLLVPPTVVVVGRPNVGKSMLSNRMIGRAASLVADLPGTTRDWVGGGASLQCKREKAKGKRGEVVVRWLDTPGVRESGDEVERAAIAAARDVVARADVLIVMRDPATDWPDAGVIAGGLRQPDVRVMNKADLGGEVGGDVLRISAATGEGVERLAEAVLGTLGLDDVREDVPWAFSDTLRRYVRGESVDLAAYVGA